MGPTASLVVLLVVDGTSEVDFTKLALQMSAWNGDGDVHGGNRDNDDMRCYAYVMEGGICVRSNTLVTYCEANRQVG